MLQRIGLVGVFGLLVVAAGLGLVAWESPVVAAGIATMVLGLGIVVQSVVSRALAQFGLAGALPQG
jgi:hypothetical protein